jgi:hypothetical protein
MRQTSLLLFVLLLIVDLACAQEPLKRKSGLWEITRTSTYTGDQSSRMQLCVDEASDNVLKQLAEGMRGESCATDKLSRDGDNLVVDATCKLRASTSKTHAVISGKFDSAYTIQSKSTYSPPLAGKTAGHAVLTGKWTGPCATGQSPGETFLGNGVTIDSGGFVHAPKVKTSAKEKNKDAINDKAKGKKAAMPAPTGATTNPPAPSQ